MDLRELAQQPAADRRHPWEIARARFFRRRIAKHRPVGAVADIGCGDAWFAGELRSELSRDVEIWAVDPHFTEKNLSELGRDGVRLATEVPAARAFGALILLDVLEHVRDDRDFLRKLVRENLADRGFVLIAVPAYPQLFSEHDRWLGHERRYTPAQGRALAQSSGLEIVEEGGLFFTLLMIRFLQTATGRIGRAGVANWRGGSVLTRILVMALNADALLARWLPGLSWWCVCRKA